MPLTAPTPGASAPTDAELLAALEAQLEHCLARNHAISMQLTRCQARATADLVLLNKGLELAFANEQLECQLAATRRLNP
jgi:hypothetical protein